MKASSDVFPKQFKRKKSSSTPTDDRSKIARRIIAFMEEVSPENGHPRHKFRKYSSMVDVGCGDGWSTIQFAPYFETVTGIDKSKQQITKAQENIHSFGKIGSSVQFQIATGERMPFKDSSQDLVCFSRSFHWMELMSNALREAKRVLKPNGCLAMYCTGFPKISLHREIDRESGASVESDKGANETLDHFFRHVCEVHPRCTLAVDDKYQRIYDAIIVESKRKRGSKFLVVDDDNLLIHKRYVTLTEFAEMLRSYAGYKCAMMTIKKQKEAFNTIIDDPLDNLLVELKNKWGNTDCRNEDIFLTVTWDIALILSTRPSKFQ